MATDLKPYHLAEISRPIPFEKLDEVMDQFFNVTVVGRIVVEVGSKAPKSTNQDTRVLERQKS
jgi:hypothetical protein